MKLRTTVAGLTASALAVGGLFIGGSAAFAALPPVTEYVPVVDIATPGDGTAESAVYNQWHFDPDHQADYGQEPNGLIVGAAGDVLVMLGNGNDVVPAGGPLASSNSIEHIAGTVGVGTSDLSKVAYQIPVFYAYNTTSPNAWKYTTLRHSAADASDNWISSSAITGPTLSVAANTATPLADIVAALNEAQNDARPIGVGFIVKNPGADVLVSSFVAPSADGSGYTLTKFYDAPVVDGLKSDAFEFVTSDDIRPDESTYPGWHQGASGETLGTYTSLVENGATKGLDVTGKSQILNGYADADFTNNNLLEILAAGVSVVGDPSDDAAGFTFQVPIFFYVDGVIGQQYTTLRTEVPADGVITADALWTTSGAIGSIYARGDSDQLEDLLSLMSSYQIIGHGFYVESGSVLAQSVTFNGLVTSFEKAAAVTPVPETPKGPEKLANTGAANNWSTMAGIAALALMALGGVTLAARRARQS